MEILCSVPQCELVNVEHRGATKIRSLARLCNAYKMELVACVTGFQVIQDKCSGNSECSKGFGIPGQAHRNFSLPNAHKDSTCL